MKLEDMSVKQLQVEHRKRRQVIAGVRAEMDQIEVVLEPKLARQSALEKLAKAGLSPAEIKSIKPKAD